MTALMVLLVGTMHVVAVGPGEPEARLRLVVLTDVSSLTAGVAEPDDGQSLIRLMLYSNEFQIDGLIATSNLGHGRRCRPDLIRQVVDAYARVRPNLLLHDSRYPDPAELSKGIEGGQPDAGLKSPVEASVGEGKDTAASGWIVQVVDRPDPRPVWVLIWGGSADLAQALWKVRRTRTGPEVERFLSRLRVHSISDQDSTGPWIRREFPKLSYITQQRAYRGMYRGGNSALVASDWVRTHIHKHGALGDLYPDYNGGDIWSGRLGRVRGIKEGDTPSFLSLVPNGLTDPHHPWAGSWGGRFEGAEATQHDVADRDVSDPADPDPRMSSVYRWRAAFQADFQARLDWCVQPFKGANHPPAVAIAGSRERRAKPGEIVDLDASRSADPDHDGLDFEWSVYPAGSSGATVAIDGAGERVARVRVASASPAGTVPILLTVRDRGNPPLTRYGRVYVQVGERP